MRTMVDAKQLSTYCKDRRHAYAFDCLETEPFDDMLKRIDELSVEVPDTPDVLGKLRAWLEKEKATYLHAEYSRDSEIVHGARTMANEVLAKLDELQAKKE